MTLFNKEDGSCTSSGSGLMHGINRKTKNCSDSESTSSIGKNNDITGGEDSGDSTGEVESLYKGTGLDAMETLEQVLPFRRGISRFYNGKSKSFASLARASSIQDLMKTENAYTRRRRNLLASSLVCDKNRFSAYSSLKSSGGGVSKKTATNMSRTNLALAVAITATSSEADSNSSTSTCDDSELEINLVSPTLSSVRKSKLSVSRLSCIHRDMSTWRSFSLADLQCASAAAATGSATTQCSTINSTIRDETHCPL